MELFKKFKKQDTRNEQGIKCDKSVAACGLGNIATVYAGAVFYGGNCGECGSFKQGDAIGNMAMYGYDDDGSKIYYPEDPSVAEAVEAGVEIRPFTACPLQLK